MTQQGKRQARFRQWAGTTSTYNGDMMSAGLVAGGGVGSTVNEAEWWIHGAMGATQDTLSGRQAYTAQYLNVPSGWDAVGDELPYLGFDFTSGGLFPGLTYGSSFEGAISRDSLVFRPGGQARTSSLGLLAEPQTTNKCTNTNMKMVDASGTTPDAAWTTHGPIQIGSWPQEVFDALPAFTDGKLRASYISRSNAAGIITIDGVTGNSNPHTGSVWLYVVSGTIRLRLSGSVTSVDITPSGTWVRASFTELLPGAAETLVVESLGPSEVYWFGNQLEENSGRTSLIEVNGGSATRLGDKVRTPWPAGISGTSYTAAVEYSKFLPSGSDLGHVIEFSAGALATPLIRLIVDGTPVQRINDAVTNYGSAPYVLGDTRRHSFGLDGANATWSQDGTLVLAFTPTTGTFTTVEIGHSAGSGINAALGGYIKNFALYNEPGTQANTEQKSGG